MQYQYRVVLSAGVTSHDNFTCSLCRAVDRAQHSSIRVCVHSKQVTLLLYTRSTLIGQPCKNVYRCHVAHACPTLSFLPCTCPLLAVISYIWVPEVLFFSLKHWRGLPTRCMHDLVHWHMGTGLGNQSACSDRTVLALVC
eukprot:scpid37495/ scgid35013/ 